MKESEHVRRSPVKGLVIELRRMDTTLTKVELLAHLARGHSQVPIQNPSRLSKQTILDLHRLIHWGIDR